MKKSVKIIIGAVLALATGAGAVYYALMPLDVEISVLEPADALLTFIEEGAFGYESEYQVFPVVAGEVLEVRVREGQLVSSGDVLAVVSATDYEYQIEQLESSIEGYRGQISNLALQEQQSRDSLTANIEALKGQLATLEAEMRKNEQSDRSLSSQISIQQEVVHINRRNLSVADATLRDALYYGDAESVRQAQQAYNAAQNSLAQSELVLEQIRSGGMSEDVYAAQRSSLEAQIEALSAQMGKSYTGGMRQYYDALIASATQNIDQLRDTMGKTEIPAPVSGRISSLPVKNANIVSQQAAVAVISQEETVEVFVPVREIDGVKTGDTVELILDKRLGEEILEGTVSEIGDKAQVKLSALGVEERKVRVLIKPAQPLLVGSSMDVRFTVLRRPDSLIVPKTALFKIDGADYVWLANGGKLASVPVEKGVETREGFVIESGLSAGDQVVRDANNEALAPGKAVAVAAAAAAA